MELNLAMPFSLAKAASHNVDPTNGLSAPGGKNAVEEALPNPSNTPEIWECPGLEDRMVK